MLYKGRMAQEDMRPLHILIPLGMHERLREMAEVNDRSVAAETRRAIEERLQGFEAPDEAKAGAAEMASLSREEKVAKARELKASGVGVADIASRLNCP
jgi:predicted DNA-binding protein